jgi:hypothetical protein
MLQLEGALNKDHIYQNVLMNVDLGSVIGSFKAGSL